MRFSRRLLALLPALALACTDGGGTAAPTPPVSATPTVSATPAPSSATPTVVASSPTASPSATVAPASCSTTYAEPDPDRPVVDLRFVVADTKKTVTGTEEVRFTPDLPVDRLVFRLWASSPVPRASGGSSRVTKATVNGQDRAFGTGDGGTLVTIPLGTTAPAGTSMAVRLEFTLTLPDGANERLGHQGGTAWFGSGFPLLAWQRGRGWATEPATSAFAEAATSEAFLLQAVEVDTKPGDNVIGLGLPVETDGRARRWRGDAFSRSVRDVMIAVGPFRMAPFHGTGDGVRVGVAPGLPDEPARLRDLHLAAVRGMEARFGPRPFLIDVAVVPYLKGGVEFPGSILLGTRQDRDATLVHEVAHQWFYGLVGNNQGRSPWLDEAFATYAEALVRGTSSQYLSASIPSSGVNRVGAPMTYWESRKSAYYRSVYVQGAAMLLRARRSAGAAAWDRAMRCYVAANAYRIATPEDVRRAFAAFPEAVALMRRMGAVP